MMATLKVLFPTVIYLWRLLSLTWGQAVVEMSMAKQQDIYKPHEVNVPVFDEKPFSFASYYSDQMVLQRAPKRAVIWGYGPNIGEKITIKLGDKGTFTTNVYLDPLYNYGVWKIKLPAESSPGPFTITASSSNKTIQLNDVMFGDVWVCSGQSNMQFTLIQAFNATEEIADANNYPDIRLFTVSDYPSATPIPDLKRILENWVPAASASVGGPIWKYFSAVCWLYGKALYKELGYPIGLIDTTWGGTPVESWSSPDALAKCGLDNQLYEINEVELKQLYKDGLDMMVDGPQDTSNLWNSMVNPLINMTIYGAIWYQGEANTVRNVNKYNCTFPAMIADWRDKFHSGSDGETDPMFPFGFVQLAANRPGSLDPGFPKVRWHQTADYGFVPNPKMQNVFMAVAIDLPDFASRWKSVHPRDKQDVAARLTLSGLSVAYKRPGLVYQGPLPSHIQEGANNISLVYPTKIEYNNVAGFEGLCAAVKSNMTFWFLLALVHPVQDQPNSLTLLTDVCGQGQRVIGLRYLWLESPCDFKMCTVYSAENPLLPGPPFIVYKEMTKVEGTVHKIDWNSPTAITV